MAFIISGFSDEINSDIDIQLESISSLGIKYFEPRGINEKNVSALTPDEASSLAEKMKHYGIKASAHIIV